MQKSMEVGYAYIRLFMAAATDAVDIEVNGEKVKHNFKFGDFTEYKRALPGRYNFSVYSAKYENKSPLIHQEMTIEDGKVYTICISGEKNTLKIDLVPDTPKHENTNMAYVRLIHLSPNTPPVDIDMDNKRLISGISYLDYTDYYKITPTRHNMTVYIAGTPAKILTNPNATFKANNYYACYLVGLSDEKPPLQFILPLEGVSYVEFT